MSICDECVCPSLGVLLQLNREEVTKGRRWDETSMERKIKIMVDENMKNKKNEYKLSRLVEESQCQVV